VTARDLLSYIWGAEDSFRLAMQEAIEDMKEDGGVSHTKLKRIAKKAAVKLLQKIQREEKK
jgi:hypothetical protein